MPALTRGHDRITLTTDEMNAVKDQLRNERQVRNHQRPKMTEAAEIAINIAIWIARKDLPETFTEALALVRRVAPDMGTQMTDNVATELVKRGPFA